MLEGEHFVVEQVVVMVVMVVEMDPQAEPRQNMLEAACLEAPGTLASEVVEGLVWVARRASGPRTGS